MELTDKMILFNLLIMMFWAIAFVPLVLKANFVWPLIMSSFVLISIELIIQNELSDYPLNILRGVFMLLMSSVGAYSSLIKHTKEHVKIHNYATSEQKLTNWLSER